MDSIAQGPLDLSRFDTPDIEDKIPALTQGVVAGRRRRKIPSTLTPTAQFRLAESRMTPGRMRVSAAKKPKTPAEMVRILTAPPVDPAPQYVLCGVCETSWHRDEYETCLKCSGVKLCGECETNYHAKDYDRCYACHRGSGPGAGKQW